jgi:hypothetical protein
MESGEWRMENGPSGQFQHVAFCLLELYNEAKRTNGMAMLIG